MTVLSLRNLEPLRPDATPKTATQQVRSRDRELMQRDTSIATQKKICYNGRQAAIKAVGSHQAIDIKKADCRQNSQLVSL